MKPLLRRSGAVLALVVSGLVVHGVSATSGCARPVTPNDVEAGSAIANDLCSWLEGITDNGNVISICATAEEIAAIASIVAPLLHDDPATCTTLPGTAVCASPRQLGRAIGTVLLQRRARFLLDAGAP